MTGSSDHRSAAGKHACLNAYLPGSEDHEVELVDRTRDVGSRGYMGGSQSVVGGNRMVGNRRRGEEDSLDSQVADRTRQNGAAGEAALETARLLRRLHR